MSMFLHTESFFSGQVHVNGEPDAIGMGGTVEPAKLVESELGGQEVPRHPTLYVIHFMCEYTIT